MISNYTFTQSTNSAFAKFDPNNAKENIQKSSTNDRSGNIEQNTLVIDACLTLKEFIQAPAHSLNYVKKENLLAYALRGVEGSSLRELIKTVPLGSKINVSSKHKNTLARILKNTERS